MTWLSKAGASLTLGFVSTMFFAVVSLVWVMFTTHPGDPRQYGFFGALFFEVREKPTGALDLGVGLENAVPLIVAFALLSVFAFAVMLALSRLREHKKVLMATQSE